MPWPLKEDIDVKTIWNHGRVDKIIHKTRCKSTFTVHTVEEPNDSNVIVSNKGFGLVNGGKGLGGGAGLLLQPGDDGVSCSA